MDQQGVSNPFLGLRFFDTDDATLFFGRDGQSDALLRILEERRFVAVVGSSGSGKSSLVKAGLVPALYSGMMRQATDWRIAYCRPGNDPIGNLAWALNHPESESTWAHDDGMQSMFTEVTLRRSSLGLAEYARSLARGRGENLLVIVDQFEELFRYRHARRGTDDDAAAFTKLLLEAAHQHESSVYVVLTMRSDFLGDCAQFYGLIEAINDGQFLIPRMTRDDRQMTISGPVAMAGGTITPRLVNRLLNDIGDSPDQLPIIQHALMRTWDYSKQREQDAPLDLSDYEAIGGMHEALSLHADEAYSELSENGRRVAEKIFKALTEKDERNYMWRRPAPLRELCEVAESSSDEVVAAIETFRQAGRSFLMPPPPFTLNDETIVDISHESLIRNWPRLRKWVEDEARAANMYRRLAESAKLYREGRAGLFRNPELQLALQWYESQKPNQAWASRYHPEFKPAIDFLNTSHARRDAEIEEQARKQEEERRRQTAQLEQAQALVKYQELAAKRLRALIGLAAVVLVSIVTTIFAATSWKNAVNARNDTENARAEVQRALEAARVSEEKAIVAQQRAEEDRKIAKDAKEQLDALLREMARRPRR